MLLGLSHEKREHSYNLSDKVSLKKLKILLRRKICNIPNFQLALSKTLNFAQNNGYFDMVRYFELYEDGEFKTNILNKKY